MINTASPADTSNINSCVGNWRGIPLPYLKKIARLNNYIRKVDAAKKLHKILQEFASKYGYTAEDVFYRPPEEAKYYVTEHHYANAEYHYVSFEGGPPDWGIKISHILSNDNWYTECCYPFDVLFVDTGG